MAYDFIAGGETRRRVKSALSLCQRGGTGAMSGVNQRTLRHPENTGETHRRGRSALSHVPAVSVSSRQGQSEDQQTQRDPETGECVCV